MHKSLARFTSRKFLLTISTVGLLYYTKQYEAIIYVVLGYIGAEGATDAVGAYSQGKATVAEIKKSADLISSGVLSPNDEAGIDDADRKIQPGY